MVLSTVTSNWGHIRKGRGHVSIPGVFLPMFCFVILFKYVSPHTEVAALSRSSFLSALRQNLPNSLEPQTANILWYYGKG